MDNIATIGISFTTPVLVHVAGPIKTSCDMYITWQQCKLCDCYLVDKQVLHEDMVNNFFTVGSYVTQDGGDRLKETDFKDIPPQTRMCR